MKYKVLLSGSGRSVHDAFFIHMEDAFESMITTDRTEDFETHMKYFQPDVFVYAINSETKLYINHISSFHSVLARQKVPFVIIGSPEECDRFNKNTLHNADLVLRKPLTNEMIKSAIGNLIEGLRAEEGQQDAAKEEPQQKNAPQQKNVQNSEPEVLEQTSDEIARILEATRRRHILVVDDDSLMLKTVKRHLEEEYDVATALSGQLAIRFLAKKQTDLILLDYEMPGETGPEVLQRLRDNERTKDIPVVFLTGIADENKIRKVLVMKPQGYLLKPINHEKLHALIHKILFENTGAENK